MCSELAQLDIQMEIEHCDCRWQLGTRTASPTWALAASTSDRVFDRHVLNHECLGLVAHLLHNLWASTHTLCLQIMPSTYSALH